MSIPPVKSASNAPVRQSRPSRRALWILAGFFVLLFLAGGSSWRDAPGLTFVRPIAVLIAGYGLATLDVEQLRRHKVALLIFASALALTALHLVPLPAPIWQSLPGREILIEIDRVAGHLDIARPLSMSPDDTRNALYALTVPLAVLFCAIQLDLKDHARLMMIILGLIIMSGLLTVLQASGSTLQLYHHVSVTPGVFANRNHEAALLATAIPMLAACAYFAVHSGADRQLTHIVAAALGLAIIPIVIVGGSRTGLLVLAIAIFLLPLFIFHQPDQRTISAKSQKPAHRNLGRWIIWGSGFSAIAIMVWTTIAVSRGVAIARLETSDVDLRYQAWTNVVTDLPNWMPWGAGIGSFADVYQINEASDLLQPNYLNHAHNDWLEVAYTAGVPGICIAIAAAIAVGFGALRSLRLKGRTAMLSRTGILVMILLAFASVSDYPVRTPLLSALVALAAIWAAFRKRLDDEFKDA